MRRLILPLILISLFVFTPCSALADGEEAALDKLKASIESAIELLNSLEVEDPLVTFPEGTKYLEKEDYEAFDSLIEEAQTILEKDDEAGAGDMISGLSSAAEELNIKTVSYEGLKEGSVRAEGIFMADAFDAAEDGSIETEAGIINEGMYDPQISEGDMVYYYGTAEGTVLKRAIEINGILNSSDSPEAFKVDSVSYAGVPDIDYGKLAEGAVPENFYKAFEYFGFLDNASELKVSLWCIEGPGDGKLYPAAFTAGENSDVFLRNALEQSLTKKMSGDAIAAAQQAILDNAPSGVMDGRLWELYKANIEFDAAEKTAEEDTVQAEAGNSKIPGTRRAVYSIPLPVIILLSALLLFTLVLIFLALKLRANK